MSKKLQFGRRILRQRAALNVETTFQHSIASIIVELVVIYFVVHARQRPHQFQNSASRKKFVSAMLVTTR